jgi:ribosomal protein S8
MRVDRGSITKEQPQAPRGSLSPLQHTAATDEAVAPNKFTRSRRTGPLSISCLSEESLGTMVRISVLHDALKTMYNAEKRGKRQVLVRPASKVVIMFLQLMMKHGYIGEFEFVDDHRAGKIVVHLNGRLNKCGCISPRYDVGHDVRSLVHAYSPLRCAATYLLGFLAYHGSDIAPRACSQRNRQFYH